MINKFSTLDNDFDSELDSLIAWDSSIDEEISNSVKKIIDDVRHIGDSSVLDYTQQFDSIMAKSISELTISKERLKQSFDNLKRNKKMRSRLRLKELNLITKIKFKSLGITRRMMAQY